MKKLITLLLAAALMTPAAALAEDTDVHIMHTSVENDAEPVVIADEAAHPAYVRTDATIQKVTERDSDIYIDAVDAGGEPVNFIVVSDAIITGENQAEAALEEGAVITAYTAWNKPMVLMLPPQYHPDIIVVDTEDGVFTDADNYTKDGERYVNADGTLSISTEDAEIVDEEGTEYTDELDGKNLLVFYGASTRSIPAQTNPIKIVVLNEQEEDIPAEELPAEAQEFETVEIDGIEMLPVRAVAESLGLDVAWDDTLKAVSVGTVQMGVNFRIGENSYNKAKMMPFVLECAPVLVETDEGGVTYVPVSFFSEVLGIEK